MPRPARFTRDDWAAAALELLAEGGPAAVAVEPAAARLGASKSSFYWLFPNRQALLEAALLTWEQQQTDAVLPGLAAIADPAERLRRLARAAFAATQPADLALRLLTEPDPLVQHGGGRCGRVLRGRAGGILLGGVGLLLRRSRGPGPHLRLFGPAAGPTAGRNAYR